MFKVNSEGQPLDRRRSSLSISSMSVPAKHKEHAPASVKCGIVTVYEPKSILDAVEQASWTCDAILTNGGTGLAKRDVTIPTLLPSFDRTLPGFGELFRALSYQVIGSPAMLSGAVAGVYHGRLVFCLPGSPDACRLAVEKLILPELGHAVGVMER